MADKALRGTTEAVVRTLEPLFAEEGARLESLRGALADAAGRVEASLGHIGELSTSLDGVAREQVAALDRHGQSLLAAFDRVLVGGGTALTESAGTLAAAARQLQGGAEVLGPRLDALSTELGALAREVALLLAARGPDGDVGAIVLGELERLGAGFDRLAELVRMSRSEADAAAIAEAETASAAPAETDVAPAEPAPETSSESASERASEPPSESAAETSAEPPLEGSAPGDNVHAAVDNAVAPIENAAAPEDAPDPERA